MIKRCKRCRGTGSIARGAEPLPCPNCKGTARVETAETVETRGVLAGAYLRADDRKACLTHAVVVADGREVSVLCSRVRVENICDATFSPESIHLRPTCTVCARRDPRSH